MTPWEDLADYWRNLAELQVYETMTEQLDVPCIAIMPGEPWIVPGGFSSDPESYLAYAVAGSADAGAAQRQIHQLLHFMRHSLPEGWLFESAGAPAQREHEGVTYLAAETRLTFTTCTGGNPYDEGASS